MTVETTTKDKDPAQEATTAGNYFVSNYPPYSFWSPAEVARALASLDRQPEQPTPLGVYLHIPFCRKRCHFCYFKVYTDKRSSEIREYIDACMAEFELYAKRPLIAGRKTKFVYFGGGTPSYLSSEQLIAMTDRMKELLPWDKVEEVTFECEPGTLTESKLRVLKDIGVTRLSLGIENFDEHILEINGRAHRAKEIDRAYQWARQMDFPQINIDLIAGMLDETESNWAACIEQAIKMEPDSITIYQMEIPFNTTIYQRMQASGRNEAPVADWDTKRRWVSEAFSRLEAAGYHVGSAYTAVRDSKRTTFVYRDELWRGADLLPLGVSSFGHLNGTHYQNQHRLEDYLASVRKGELPIYRALTPTNEELLIREFVLQFKLGRLTVDYFQNKYRVDVTQRFAEQLDTMTKAGFLEIGNGRLQLTRPGLLQIDRLLHGFFLPEHQNARYA